MAGGIAALAEERQRPAGSAEATTSVVIHPLPELHVFVRPHHGAWITVRGSPPRFLPRPPGFEPSFNREALSRSRYRPPRDESMAEDEKSENEGDRRSGKDRRSGRDRRKKRSSFVERLGRARNRRSGDERRSGEDRRSDG